MAERLHTREDSGIRLDRQLRWWHDGELIEHPNIIRAFNSGLEPTDDGRFILRFGWDWCYVQVEDAAYAVTAVDATADGDGLSVRLSDGTAERLEPGTVRVEDGVLTCRVKRERAKARFSRDAQYALGQLLEPAGAGVILRVGRLQLPVPNLDPAALTS
ncbi:MAG TPA: DUF1285 domain-containing protein [Myxococcales bacterium]|nr:DUF1285 domain-containing protein [Myxococcales bacterium]